MEMNEWTNPPVSIRVERVDEQVRDGRQMGPSGMRKAEHGAERGAEEGTEGEGGARRSFIYACRYR